MLLFPVAAVLAMRERNVEEMKKNGKRRSSYSKSGNDL